MKIGDIPAVQSVEPIASTSQQSRDDELRKSPAKPRHQFSRVFDEGDGVVYRVVDEETGMILAQVPSEEVLRVAKRLQEMLSDRKAK